MEDQRSPVSNPVVAGDAINTGEENARSLIEAPSDKGFTIGLYLEHLEEASFLYDQRLVLLEDPELAWVDLHDFEERFEAHIDALILGEDLAQDVCLQQAEEGDSGELHAATRVFCRHHKWDVVSALIEALDPDDDERCRAMRDALCHEPSEDLLQGFARKMTEGQPAFMTVALRPIGYRRMPGAEVLVKSLQQLHRGAISDPAVADRTDRARTIPDPAVADAVWSLGRIHYPGARPILYDTFLQHEAEEVRAVAAVALLRIGEPAALQYCAGVARSQPWALRPIGLGGNRSHVKILMDIAASEAVSPECMIALGLLGEASAVEPLLYHLGDERLSEAASLGLYLITGAPLFEEVFIPEAVDEDDLFDDEREGMEGGDIDPSQDDEPRGTTHSRVTQQAEAWQAWWRDNQARYERGVRYRNGGPYGPESLLANLTSEQSPWIVRQLAAEELVIRYGCDLPFETDMFVARQMEVLTGIRAWLDGVAGRFTAGRWYAAGRIASS